MPTPIDLPTRLANHRQQRRSLYGSGEKPFILIKADPYPFRRVVYFSTLVRPDDHPLNCLSCRQAVRVGQEVVVRRSCHEQTPKCYGPIEAACHLSCWYIVSLSHGLPALGPKGARMERYGDQYPWSPQW